jgi:4-diphosphocytidyl-2-C-methyl-D-erythritol kinase
VHNCFEAALFRSHPAIRSARDALRDLGAIALVSGSGASVFGVFALLSEAVSAEQTLRGRYAFVARTAIAQSGVRLDFE